MIDEYEKAHADECGETSGTETLITCPYCGHFHNDTWECGMSDGDVDEDYECGMCEKSFRLVCTVSRTFQSKKKQEKP